MIIQFHLLSQPEFNGMCVPVKCAITDFHRNIYNIPDNVLTCDSNIDNCGIDGQITCKKPEHSFEDSATLRCLAPQKVEYNKSSPQGFLSMSGCQNLDKILGEELFELNL